MATKTLAFCFERDSLIYKISKKNYIKKFFNKILTITTYKILIFFNIDNFNSKVILNDI